MAYRYMYEVEIKHDGLNKYRVIRGSNRYVVEQKAQAQMNQWNEMWEKKQVAETKKAERENIAREKEAKKALAEQQTQEASEEIKNIENTLLYTLEIDDKINWDSLKDQREFKKAKPASPTIVTIPEEPNKSHEQFQPHFNLFDKFFTSIKKKKIDQMNKLFERYHDEWEIEKTEAEKQNEASKRKYEDLLHEWEVERKAFIENQEEKNKAIDQQIKHYNNAEPTAIIDYCDMVLSNSDYPDEFPQEFDIDYNPVTKMLITEYSLPSPDKLPNLKEVKYIQSRDEFKKSYLSDSAMKKLYDTLLYQITLRTLHELYEADAVNALDSVVFNGWVKSVDKATGQEVNACILSIQASKEEFVQINLSKVDPKLCFKNLKGIGSSKLHSLSPVAPIIKIDREDPRFVSSYAIANTIDESVNLAAMDWQDFEHLIRELFEKEFNQSGGEVKITRASKDGGVDAVAFDPDPLRGGKIVIQAKRYTNLIYSYLRDETRFKSETILFVPLLGKGLRNSL
ncbi:restriction system protein, partial [Scopulibacillus darangshiensis]